MQGADYNKLERNESKRIGAKQQKNSGRGQYQKGDAVLGQFDEEFVVDFKFADKSVSLNESMWAKICTDAMKVDPDKSPMLYIVLGGKTRLAVVEYAILEDLMEMRYNGEHDKNNT